MNCPSCNTENPDGARFCMTCGTRMDRSCASCGNDLPEGAAFCPNCGTPVQEPAAAPTQQASTATASSSAAPAETRSLHQYVPAELLTKLESAQ